MSAPQSRQLQDRLSDVRAGISSAIEEAGRRPSTVTTIVVTKFQPVSLVRELHELGIRNFGESRHQEAQHKSVELSDLGLTWHFVGQLQSKKVRHVAAYARVLHSLDRDSVVDALEATEQKAEKPKTEAFLQVNLTEDTARGGVADRDLERMTERILSTRGLRLLGVMAVAPLGQEPRAAFARLRGASDRVRALDPTANFISAGMSGDFREAILEGATHLRIGTAITGNRPVAG